MIKVQLLVIVLIIFPSTFSEDKIRIEEPLERSKIICSMKSKDKCFEPLRLHLSVKHYLAYGRTDQELTNTCRKIQRVTECLQKLIEQCESINDRIKTQVDRMLSGHKSLEFELCVANSPLRLKYLKYGPCVDRLGHDLARCIQEYNEEMDLMIQEIPHKKQKFGYIHTDSYCCAIDKHNECTRRMIEPRCNHSAAELAKELFRITSGDISNECQMGAAYRECSACKKFINNFLIFSIITLLFLLQTKD